jgi:hypothetical protein
MGRATHKDSNKIYFAFLWYFYKFSTNFESFNKFMKYLNEIRNLKRDLGTTSWKLAHNLGPADPAAYYAGQDKSGQDDLAH